MRKLSLHMLGFVLLASTHAVGQNTDILALAGLQFNFANPGARAMGMGGAFLGLADDASATEANPAGLTILRSPEVSLEIRNFRIEREYPVGGVFPDIETERFATFSKTADIAFASVVWPVGEFALAVYYHHPLNYNSSAQILPLLDQFGFVIREVPKVFITNDPTIPPISEDECLALPPGQCFEASILPFTFEAEADLETYGLAGAWKMGSLSIGLSLRYQEFEERAFEHFFFDQSLLLIRTQATRLDPQSGKTGAESDLSIAGGLMWEITKWLSVAAAYKQGAEFDAPVHFMDPLVHEEFQKILDTRFHVPDVVGAGVSVRPFQTLTLNADIVHVTYSNLVDDFQTASIATSFLQVPFEADDVTEIHLGGEYFLPTRIPFAIRLGWWRDPAHSLTYVGPVTCPDPNILQEDRLACVANRAITNILFPEGKDENHYSMGVGLAWPRFQVDAAYDTSDGFKVGSISAVYRF